MIRQFCYLVMKASGWKFVNKVPDTLRSFILLGAPHTSNHDFLPAMALSAMMKRNAKFVIKHDWLKFPLNLIMVPLGAHGIDREKNKLISKESNTEVMANFFKDFSELVLMITPEGTRRPTSKWKTGFYYIAQKAHVPIVLGYADFEKKEAGLGMVIYPSNFEQDMRKIMDFYRHIRGKNPQKFQLDERYSQ
jgi:1-acyl-sn-glycerol-3-phosphate acyltransferase